MTTSKLSNSLKEYINELEERLDRILDALESSDSRVEYAKLNQSWEELTLAVARLETMVKNDQ